MNPSVAKIDANLFIRREANGLLDVCHMAETNLNKKCAIYESIFKNYFILHIFSKIEESSKSKNALLN